MKTKILSGWAVASISFVLASCSLNPSWLLDPDGYDWDSKRKVMLDTPRNRTRFTREYDQLIQREANNEPGLSWEIIWKGIFESLDRADENPNFYQQHIIQERRKRGLPELNF